MYLIPKEEHRTVLTGTLEAMLSSAHMGMVPADRNLNGRSATDANGREIKMSASNTLKRMSARLAELEAREKAYEDRLYQAGEQIKRMGEELAISRPIVKRYMFLRSFVDTPDLLDSLQMETPRTKAEFDAILDKALTGWHSHA